MKTNVKATSPFVSAPAAKRVAGGFGALADKITPEQQLRRCVLTNLLWEDAAYESGKTIADTIKAIIPSVPAEIVAEIAVEARTQQKLRHVPLLLAREMARLDTHKHVVANTLEAIIQRPDELTEFLAIYQKDGKDQPLSAQVKKGLARAFRKFDAYSLAKYNRDNEVKLKDVLFLVHGKPADIDGLVGKKQPAIAKATYSRGQVRRHAKSVYTALVNGTLATPDTWEVELSASKDKKASWTRLLVEGKLGALAFIRNLRNLTEQGIDKNLVRDYFAKVNPERLLPFNFLAAAQQAPEFTAQLESLMLKCLAAYPKLPGKTVFVVDVSGSMGAAISGKSVMSRLDAAAALTSLMREVCETPIIYATAGSDGARKHKTAEVPAGRGFALMDQIRSYSHSGKNNLGGGGIFLVQSTNHIAAIEKDAARLIVLSDSQDCDHVKDPNASAAFGEYNYLFDVSCHTKGVAYKRFVHIDGWSEKLIDYIYAYEGLSVQ